MKRKRPMLVITLQIPLTEDLSAEDVLEALREQTEAALQMVRERMLQEDGEDDSEYEETEVPAPTVALAGLETMEPFSDETKDDILGRLGYKETD
jgi:hypothetical protein